MKAAKCEVKFLMTARLRFLLDYEVNQSVSGDEYRHSRCLLLMARVRWRPADFDSIPSYSDRARPYGTEPR